MNPGTLSMSSKQHCPICLFEFRASDRLARCRRGCTPTGTSTQSGPSESLIFDPRETGSSGRLPWSGTAAPKCPRCGAETAVWVCPSCKADLPSEGASDEVVSMVGVGPAHAGKTTFLAMCAREVESHLGPLHGFVLDPWDREAQSVVGALKAGKDLPSLLGAARAEDGWSGQPWRFRLLGAHPKRGESVWMSVFDTPGQAWEERDEAFLNAAQFVTSSRALILILDPTRFGPVEAALRKRESTHWSAQGASRSSASAIAPARRVSALDEIRHLSLFFGRRGVALPTQVALAIVLTKLDSWADLAPVGTLLHGLSQNPTEIPAGLDTTEFEQILHDETEALLVEWSGESLTQQLDLKFPNYRCFAVSALGEAAHAPSEISAPAQPVGIDRVVRWVLAAQGLKVGT